MAHWGLLPKQIVDLSEDELEALEYAFLLYERRAIENWSDLIGGLTGTSWPVDSLLDKVENPELLVEKRFTWSLRPPRKRVSAPLSLVLAGQELLDQLKKQAHSLEQKDRANPAVLSRPVKGMLKKGEKIEVIELGTKSKEEFLRFVQNHNLG